MRLALAQINSVVGDLDGNAATDRRAGSSEAREANADLVLFPELVVTGYPPEDLLLRPGFIRAARRAVDGIAKATRGITALVGAPHLDADLYNACFVLAHGEVQSVYRKRYLPNYGVFDEDRYFAPGDDLLLLRFGDVARRADDLRGHLAAGAAGDRPRARRRAARREHLGLAVPRRQGPRARGDAEGARARQLVLRRALQRGRRAGRADLRRPLRRARRRGRGARPRRRLRGGAARRRRRPGRRGRPPAARRAPPRARARPGARRADERRARAAARAGRSRSRRGSRRRSTTSSRCGSRSSSACTTTSTKNGFGDVVIGVSGGIDSALTAALCVEALGAGARARRLDAVALLVGGDARRRAAARRVARDRLPRAPDRADGRGVHGRPQRARSPAASADLTEENLQARIRGTLLMALSNKFGWLVIATGNKSELSVGYSTLYGDLAGGFALIKDVYKTDVFRLSRWLNERAGRELIPASIIERAPSAELRADQLDEDSLPPYPKLDKVLEAYVELDRSREELGAGRLRAGGRRPRARDDRPRRVQAPPGAAGREAAAEGVRPRPPHADHQPLAGLTGEHPVMPPRHDWLGRWTHRHGHDPGTVPGTWPNGRTGPSLSRPCAAARRRGSAASASGRS